MRPRSSGIFAPVRASASKRSGLALALALLIGAAAAAPRASNDVLADDSAVVKSNDDAPVAAPSPSTGLDPSFLLLPAWDIEWNGPPAQGVRVGDSLHLKLSQGAANLELVPPPGTEKDLSAQGWEILPDSGPGPADGYRFIAVPLKAGSLTIPSLAVKKKEGGDSAKGIARTNPFPIEVASAIAKSDPKPQEPAPPQPPTGLAFPWWIIALGSVLVLALVVGIVLAVRRYLARRRLARAPAPAVVEPPRPEDEVALKALDELGQQGLLLRREFKKHYFRVSEVLKEYLGRRFEFDAPERTAREIVQALEGQQLVAAELLDRLEILFGKLDRVKFTDHVPDADEGTRLLEDARRVVTQTRRRAVAPSGGSHAP